MRLENNMCSLSFHIQPFVNHILCKAESVVLFEVISQLLFFFFCIREWCQLEVIYCFCSNKYKCRGDSNSEMCETRCHIFSLFWNCAKDVSIVRFFTLDLNRNLFQENLQATNSGNKMSSVSVEY